MRRVITFILLLFASSVSGQTISTGPFSTNNFLAWSMTDGTTAAAAQSYEVRVRVDSAATPIVPTGAVCTSTTVTDTTGAVWSFGTGVTPSIPVLRNGVQAANAFGAKIALYQNVIYLQGDDYSWFVWTGAAFRAWVTADPAITLIDAVTINRWSCQVHLTSAIVRLLNVMGSHNITMRLYDTVAKLESFDAVPFAVTTPQVVTQPIRVVIR